MDLEGSRKYYLVPVKEDTIGLGCYSLRNLLEQTYPELLKMESKRIDILYSVSPVVSLPVSVQEEHEAYCSLIKKRYQELRIPQYLVACGNDFIANEIITGRNLAASTPAALGCCSVTKEEAEAYMRTSNYRTTIENYFNAVIAAIHGNSSFGVQNDASEEEIVVADKDDSIEVYIDGTIHGFSVNGPFKGRIKIKRMNQKNY